MDYKQLITDLRNNANHNLYIRSLPSNYENNTNP